jgi:hypothetical protein
MEQDMSNLPARALLGDSLSSRSIDRQASREISRARTYGSVVSATEVAKLEAVAEVTEAALLATSHVSAMEALLVARTPHAEARLRHIADAGCAGMAAIVFETGRRI